jgi:hypothetical protein
MSFDEATERLAQTTGGHIPKRQSEQVGVKLAQDFEAFYEMRHAQGAEASEDLLVLTTDGKGIVMHPEALREATRKAAARARPKRKTRLSPGAKRQRKRMATVAAVYTVAPYPRRPEAVMSPNAAAPHSPQQTGVGACRARGRGGHRRPLPRSLAA